MVAGAAIGAAGSIIGGSKAASGQEAAADTAAEGARYSADLQKEMFEQGRTDLTPYSTLGTTASPLLQYLVTGIMPTMTQSDLNLIGQSRSGVDQPMGYDDWYSQSYDPSQLEPMRDPGVIDLLDDGQGYFAERDTYDSAGGAPSASAQYQTYLSGYPSQDGGDTDQFALANALARQQSINALGEGYQMQESPMYSWQQEQGERALNRQAAAKGLSGSRASLNALSDFNRGLGAQEADKQYGRLLDLTNIGRGMAATGLGAGQTYAAGAGNALQGGAQQSALYSGMAAQTKGSMYENIGQGVGQMATNYLNQPQSPIASGANSQNAWQELGRAGAGGYR
jgi:hypothetical protein